VSLTTTRRARESMPISAADGTNVKLLSVELHFPFDHVGLPRHRNAVHVGGELASHC
jgi:hypothetical protein